MQLRLKTPSDVRAFSILVTVVALVGNFALQRLLMPPDVVARIAFSGSVIAVALAAPISLFIGQRLHDIHRLTVRLEQAAHRDQLTGLLTRARFYELAAARAPEGGCLILADIDHFKSVNDRFGHLAGDSVLRGAAACLRRNCRATDLVGRFGGEEFVILLPGASPENGHGAAERICTALARAPFVIRGRPAQITASFGVAPLTGPAEIDAAIAAVDAALYRAKAQGRNRVCSGEIAA